MDSAVTTLLKDPKFDLNDFLVRWKKARISALNDFLSEEAREQMGLENFKEEDLLRQINALNRAQILRLVFDQSRKFGLSASKHLRVTFEISDLRDILQNSALKCFQASWRSHNGAMVLERPGCTSYKDLGVFGCDYWREALDGLVMGVGENERLARHQSRGHGDAACVDILFTEEFTTPRMASCDSDGISSKSKYGPISNHILEKFQPLVTKFRLMKIGLIFEGVSEGTLFYRLDPEKGVLCGAGGKLMHETFLRGAKELFPDLKVLDASPLAVYGGAT